MPTQIERTLRDIAASYPPPLDKAELADVERIAFHLSFVGQYVPPGGRIADIGGGIGLMSVGAAALGYSAILVDDFADQVNHKYPIETLGIHARYGVRVVPFDALNNLPEFEPQSLDAVTTFDSMEHWHSSPKGLFHKLLEALRPGGLFLLGVPNCVNLRKRLTVPFGIGKWSSMEDWYEPKIFRGHVREPDVDDLRYIAEDLGLTDIKIFGRNWLGYHSRFPWVRALTPYADRLLQLRPSLCADIYVAGKKRSFDKIQECAQVRLATRVAQMLSRRAAAARLGLRYRHAARFSLPPSIVINGREIALDIPDEPGQHSAFVELLLDDCYHLRKIALMADITTVLDIGANIGLFGLAARAAFPEAAIHSYEPNGALEKYLAFHARQANVDYFLQAVGQDADVVSLNVDPQQSVFTTTHPDPSGAVTQVAFETALARLGGSADLVKLDCEGAEWGILEAQKCWSQVRFVTMEYHLAPGDDHDKSPRLLRAHGFRVIDHRPISNFGLVFAESLS